VGNNFDLHDGYPAAQINTLSAERDTLRAELSSLRGEKERLEMLLEIQTTSANLRGRSLLETSRQCESLRRELAACRDENAKLRITLEDHSGGSKQLAKWLEESRVEAMDAKRKAASDRARARIMRDDFGQLLERHRKDGITALFLALEELMQKVIGLDR
jgi:regulator of replication initiation timing